MVKFLSDHKIVCIIIIILAIIGIIAAVVFTSPLAVDVDSSWTKLVCDVKLIRLNTEINVYKGTEKIGTIKGNILRLLTDPLTYYDTNYNKLAYADDTYHLIAQDSHAINVKLIGESYYIYDNSGHMIGNATFDFLNLNGKITDNNGTAIVAYRANPIIKDFTIYISPECIIDEDTVLMICASYYSDHAADSRNSNNSSN